MEETARSDCTVTCSFKERGGLIVDIQSKVGSLYGNAIKDQVEEGCRALGVTDAVIHIVDQGALPFVLAARLEAAVKRGRPKISAEFLPGKQPARQTRGVKDRPRRSRLYLPGNEPKFMANAGLHRPDMVILDLEDSVAPSEKDKARFLVRNALRSVDFFDAERCVRINQGALGVEDLAMVVPQFPDVILVPKCEDADTVRSIADAIQKVEHEHHLSGETLILPIIESALGVVNAYAIASSSHRVCALAIGLEDYTADIGVERTEEGRESFYARMSVMTNAKAVGVQALDSVWSDVEDLDGLRRSTLEAKALGFDGKGCIHPRQIAVVHDAFKPTTAEVEKASQIVAAAEAARKSGLGVVSLGSKMIDAPVILRAHRILRMATFGVREEDPN
ncbi:MAG TPA: citrate lyase ACP [Bacteroidetes bacterium]|nr:citrate lyase ACP [Bacteroidota bacterium]